jgi:hypothetical protein
MDTQSLPQQARPYHGFEEFCPIAESNFLDLADECVQTSLLCARCQQIRTWLKRNLHRLEQEKSAQTLRKFNHHSSGRELEEAYRQGCHLCTILWTAFLTHRGAHRDVSRAETVRQAKSFKSALNVLSLTVCHILPRLWKTQDGRATACTYIGRKLTGQQKKDQNLHHAVLQMRSAGTCSRIV